MTKANFIDEKDIRNLSLQECIQLKTALQAELLAYLEANPTKLTRLIHSINERLNGVKQPGYAYEAQG